LGKAHKARHFTHKGAERALDAPGRFPAWDSAELPEAL